MFQNGSHRRSALKVVSALAVGALTAFALGACSSSGSQGGSATKGTITWWGWTPQSNVGKQYIAEFNKQYPNIKVTYKQVATSSYDAAIKPALASSVGPDVFNLAPGGGTGSVQLYSGSALDLGPTLKKKLGANWQSSLAPIGVKGLTVKGKVDAVPVGSTYAGTIWINPDLFKKAGVTPPTTLDQWVAACKKFDAAGITCYEQGAGDDGFSRDVVHAIANSLHPGLWAKAAAGTAKWTSPDLVKAVSIFKEMFTNGIFQKGALAAAQYPDVNNDFLAGKTAMVMMGTWYMQYSTVEGATAAVSAAGVANAKPFPMVAIRFPSMTNDAKSKTPMFGDADYGVAVNVKSKNQAAAETFVTWLGTDKKAQQVVANALNDIPSLTGIAPQWDSLKLVDASQQQTTLKNLIEQTASVSDPRLGNTDARTGQAISDALGAVGSGRQTPAQAMDTLQSSSGK